jgi:phosphate transport system substrate-binding protein
MIYKNAKLVFLVLLATAATLKSSFAFEGQFFKSHKRTYIHVVGSSTISPMMAAVSEEFARVADLNKTPVETPIVESNGTREGFKEFCGGLGGKYPDFVDASRAIEEKEIENCHSNGVKEISKIKIGYDGIVIGNFSGSKKMMLTKEQIFLALAKKVYDKKSKKLINNPYEKWNEIDAKLPDTEIKVYGPPLTSGTRDVFVDIVMTEFCFTNKDLISAYPDEVSRKSLCTPIRTDGRFIESGENDNVIVQNLKNNPDSFGIFGFNFLVVNRNMIQPVKIDNIEPTVATITSKKYELSRPLFVYFKRDNLKSLPEMRDFIKEIISAETIGSKGYLVHSGLVPLTNKELQQVRKETLSQL